MELGGTVYEEEGWSEDDDEIMSVVVGRGGSLVGEDSGGEGEVEVAGGAFNIKKDDDLSANSTLISVFCVYLRSTLIGLHSYWIL